MNLPSTIADRPRSPQPQRLYKTADGALTFGHIADPTVDEARMIASAVISTPTPDHEDDIVEPLGVVLVEYEKNPVVLWEHGFRSIDSPVAKSVIDGKLAVHVFDDRIEADCQFSHRNKTSEQIFALIADGIVRATSVRVQPLDAVVRQGREPDRMGLHVKSWAMPEWSWCMIGCNPDAVAKTLDRGRLNGSVIAPMLAKSLSSALPKSKTTTVAGVNMPTPKRNTRPKSDDTIDEDDPKSEDLEEEEDPKSDPVEGEDDPKNDTPVEPGEPVAEEESVDDLTTKPYGATVLEAAHVSIAEVVANVEAALGPMEQPEVKEQLADILNREQAILAEIEGLHAAKYPDQDSIEAGDVTVDDEGLKSWLKSSQGNRLQLAGYGTRLKKLAGAKNLTPVQRKVLGDTVKHLSRIEREGRRLVKSDDQKQIDLLAQQVKSLSERLAKRA